MISIIFHGYRMKALRQDLLPEADFEDDGIATPAPAAVPTLLPQSQMPLMVLSESAKRPLKTRGHAGAPGTGPTGQTCGTCRHVVSRRGGVRSYTKCELSKSRWTGGAGSDVRRKDPACSSWMEKRT